MVNLWDCDEENALWVVAGSHRKGKLDIGELLAAHGERLEGCGGRPLLVSRHDIAGIWVAFFSRCQRYRC